MYEVKRVTANNAEELEIQLNTVIKADELLVQVVSLGFNIYYIIVIKQEG